MLPWATIGIYLSLFGIWKVQLKTMYIAVKLANSFWVWIFVFGKRWMQSHMLYYWCFNCVVECCFLDLHLHVCVPWNSVWLVWLNSWQCLLTSCIDWTWNIRCTCMLKYVYNGSRFTFWFIGMVACRICARLVVSIEQLLN